LIFGLRSLAALMSGTKSKPKDPGAKAPDNVAAIILAAGRSRRMGEFKPLLPFGQRTVIESCVSNFRKAAIEEIVVVVGHRAAHIRQALNSVPVNFVDNHNPDGEMSVSIQLGIEIISRAASAVLITPVDHPAVPPAIVTLMIESWRAGAKLIQPEFREKGGHPVLIDLKYRHELMDLNPETGLRSFFANHRQEVFRLAVDSPFVAQDMDTWDDYLRLHKAVFGQKPAEFATPHDSDD